MTQRDLQSGRWHVATTVAAMEGQTIKPCTIGDHKVAIYRIEGGYFATSNVCTHEQALLSDGLLDGCEVECPLHGARFDIRTGEVLTGPANEDLTTYQTRLTGTDIEVFIPG